MEAPEVLEELVVMVQQEAPYITGVLAEPEALAEPQEVSLLEVLEVTEELGVLEVVVLETLVVLEERRELEALEVQLTPEVLLVKT